MTKEEFKNILCERFTDVEVKQLIDDCEKIIQLSYNKDRTYNALSDIIKSAHVNSFVYTKDQLKKYYDLMSWVNHECEDKFNNTLLALPREIEIQENIQKLIIEKLPNIEPSKIELLSLCISKIVYKWEKRMPKIVEYPLLLEEKIETLRVIDSIKRGEKYKGIQIKFTGRTCDKDKVIKYSTKDFTSIIAHQLLNSISISDLLSNDSIVDLESQLGAFNKVKTFALAAVVQEITSNVSKKNIFKPIKNFTNYNGRKENSGLNKYKNSQGEPVSISNQYKLFIFGIIVKFFYKYNLKEHKKIDILNLKGKGTSSLDNSDICSFITSLLRTKIESIVFNDTTYEKYNGFIV